MSEQTGPDPIIQAENVVKTYASGTEILEILKGISFTVSRGSSAAVTGQSGSGKSTLLNILGGLDTCDSGSVRISSPKAARGSSKETAIELFGLSETALTSYRSRQVGFIFQFHYLLKDFTALENVMLPAYIAGIPKKAALEKARVLLDDVGLDSRSHHYPSQLSGGERQRVAVARSIINDPDLVLADEPTGNLDPGNSGLVAELLYSLTEKWGKTLVVVTHDEAVASRAEIRYVLEAGRFRSQPEDSL
ncbi:ABC transporter ATP-binding protein [Breznakiella homolactica]|uniref:ABC transporter ATP-binding protein n=1 Tax=Breznakiella homolactica TaxID=2798577 RepID=A0A7T8B9B2_9SPIR|nr:ABC transporter ATP-binding protein [Breznakiella homolactica]QQO08282.1 ABC transporter ATP-binding protein [Breznakiella homolactica]